MRCVAKERKKRKIDKARIIVVPHYVGTEKNTKVFKEVIISQIQKNINKSA